MNPQHVPFPWVLVAAIAAWVWWMPSLARAAPDSPAVSVEADKLQAMYGGRSPGDLLRADDFATLESILR